MTTPPRTRPGAAFRFVVLLVRPLLQLLTKRRWSGADNLPSSGGFVVVSNHISHLDPFTFGHFLWEHGIPVRYLGKKEVFEIPVAGRIIRSAGQIPVYRESGKAADAFRDAVAAIKRGEVVGVYPEGTLTREPDLWPMRGKTGAARIALETGCPVIPIASWGGQQILGRYGTGLRLLPRKTITVRVGPPVDLADLRGGPSLAGAAAKGPALAEATERIMAALTQTLEEIRGEKAPTHRFDPKAHGLPEIGRVDDDTLRKGHP